MSDDVRDPAATLALCSWLKKQVAAWESEAKTQMALEPGERKAGKLNGAVVSYTNMVKGRKAVRVHDEMMLMAYVHHMAPTEIETIEQIRPAYRTKLLDEIQKAGKLVDSDGVVWDCAEVVEGDAYLTTKLTEEAPIVIAGLLQSGRIGIDGLRELEA
jgi:hypothetical protein